MGRFPEGTRLTAGVRMTGRMYAMCVKTCVASAVVRTVPNSTVSWLETAAASSANHTS